VLAGLLAIGAWALARAISAQQQANQAVATGDGIAITVGEFQERVRVERLREIGQLEDAIALNALQTSLGTMFQVTRLQLRLKQPQDPDGDEENEIGKEVLDQLIKEALVRQEALRRGLSATDEEIQRRMEENTGYYRDGTPTPFPTATPEPDPTATPTLAFTSVPATPGAPVPTLPLLPTATQPSEASYRRVLAESLAEWGTVGFSEADLRRLVETQMLERKLREALGAELPNPDEHITGSFIAFRSEAEAQPVVERLNAGEEFTKLVQDVRSGALGVGRIGAIPWSPRETLAPSFGDAFERHAFDTPVGGHSGLFDDGEGRYFIVYIAGREQRTLGPAALLFRQDAVFNKWLEERKPTVIIADDWRTHIPLDPALPPELAATPRPPTPAPR
jgi:hypothetical protein